MWTLSQFRNPSRVWIENKTISYFVNLPISPNLLSWLNLLFSIFAAITIANHLFFVSIIFLILAFICDTFDGIIARSKNIASTKGYLLDSGIDRLSESIWFYGLFKSGIFSNEAILLLAMAAFLSNYFRTQGLLICNIKESGFMEKGDRNFLFLFIVFLMALGYQNQYIYQSIWFLTIGTILTSFQLFRRNIIHKFSEPTDPETTNLGTSIYTIENTSGGIAS